MQHPLSRVRRARIRDWKQERGAVLLITVALVIPLFTLTAIVVVVGNGRQQEREASAAADAGSLAGAKGLDAVTQTPSGCANVRCTAAYYTFSSVKSVPAVATAAFSSTACTIDSATTGETCSEYTSGGATVAVKNPYSQNGAAAAGTLVHVKVCWDTSTPFGQVRNITSLHICGQATAINTGNSSAPVGPIPFCGGEDNFADPVSDAPLVYTFNPGDWPDEGGTVNWTKGSATAKNNADLIVLFDGRDADINLGSIVFMAPTTVSGPLGQSVQLPRIIPPDKHGPETNTAHGIGYTVQSIDAAGKLQIYTAGGTHKVAIGYRLPDDAHLKVNGQSFIYSASAYAMDSDQNPGEDCGYATWTFTHDGHGLPAGGGSCGENTFLALGVFPSNGHAAPGDSVGAYYSDESPLQSKDVTDPSWPVGANFGIDFEMSGGAFTDVNGTAYQIPPAVGNNGGYTLGPLPAGLNPSQNYNTMIKWVLPPANDPRWVNGTKYTVYLKAYDTDNNKPGNDCGIATWDYVLTGATGVIKLVE